MANAAQEFRIDLFLRTIFGSSRKIPAQYSGGLLRTNPGSLMYGNNLLMLEIFRLVIVMTVFVVLAKIVKRKHVFGLNNFDSSLEAATVKHLAPKNSLVATLLDRSIIAKLFP
jgi:hypothetical protein